MTIALRAHHLLCLLTYVGKGYNADFVVNCDATAARVAAGEDVQIVDGPDDICAPLFDTALDTATSPHCTCTRVVERDRQAARDVEALLGQPATPGARLLLDSEAVTLLRRAFRGGTIRRACDGCEWHDLCTAVAGSGYRRARL